jgi:tripartite-type tricarboxylate transporter receptor subunit TctC
LKLKSVLLFIAVACAAAILYAPVVADAAYPEKPVRVVVPAAPGGALDVIARVLMQKLGESLGAQFIIDNRGGAAGSIGAESVVRAPADGYTLMFSSSSVLAINPHLGAKTSYDILRDVAPVILIGFAPNALAVHPSLPANSVRELIAIAKARPGAIAFASNGGGTLSHLTAALFMQQAGVDMLHVPYKGAAPAVIATVAGEVPVIFSAYPSVLGQVKAGKLRALAVTSARRIAAAPTIPTVAEAALPGFESTQWWGLYGPAALPVEIVARLNREMNAILVTADTRKRLAAEGAEPAGGTPADLAAYHKTDYARWEKVIRSAGIKGE